LILAHRALKQPIAKLLHAANLLAELLWRKLMALTMKPDGRTKHRPQATLPLGHINQICLQKIEALLNLCRNLF